MIINKKIISKLKPCEVRFDNYIKHYGTKSFTSGQFMGLKNITQEDKMWVVFRLMKIEYVKLAAADIAETVLSVYQSRFPKDDRPRKAIEAARNGDSTSDAVNTSYAASYAAYTAAYNTTSHASNAAYAAAYAAHAAYAAAYAAHAVVFSDKSATYAHAAYAAKDRTAQEKLIRKICLKYLNKR